MLLIIPMWNIEVIAVSLRDPIGDADPDVDVIMKYMLVNDVLAGESSTTITSTRRVDFIWM